MHAEILNKIADRMASVRKEAKQEELSEEQFSHMKGGKAAKSLEWQKQKEQS